MGEAHSIVVPMLVKITVNWQPNPPTQWHRKIFWEGGWGGGGGGGGGGGAWKQRLFGGGFGQVLCNVDEKKNLASVS